MWFTFLVFFFNIDSVSREEKVPRRLKKVFKTHAASSYHDHLLRIRLILSYLQLSSYTGRKELKKVNNGKCSHWTGDIRT